MRSEVQLWEREYAKNVTETNSFAAGHPKTKPAPEGAGENLANKPKASGTGVQDRDGAAVLRPARDVVADRDRALLAIGDCSHPRGIYAARDEEGAHRLSAPRA